MHQFRFTSRVEALGYSTVRAIAALHVLLFAAFLWTLAGAAQAISAENAACGGEDLLAKLQQENPQKHAAVVAEADAIVNGKSVFWRVSKPGIADSWLFGTMHSADPRVATMPKRAQQAFDTSATVMIESTEILDKQQTLSAMAAARDLVFLQPSESLEQWVDPSQLERLKADTAKVGMPWTIASRMQPWMVAAAIALPVCEATIKAQGNPVLDQQIGQQAVAAGKTLVGLETMLEQFTAIASIPREFHVNALNDTLKLGDLAQSMFETTKALYLSGDTAMILPLARAYAPATYDGKGNAEFQQLLIGKRNAVMAERAAEHFTKGNAFMAVGALHLPGTDGLVELLRKAGYTVEAAETTM